MARKLIGKSALVVGGGHGLGREIALAYGEEGADVAVASRTPAEIEAVAKEISAMGRKALATCTDVCRQEQVDQMVRRTVEEFGKIDILVNSAGSAGEHGPVWKTTTEAWQLVLDTYLTGAFRCIKAVVPHMIKQKGGVIINLSSWVGQPYEYPVGFGAYSIAKWGIEGLTQLLSAELAEFKVRVNAIRPGGPVATPAVIGKGEPTEDQLEFLNQLTGKHGPIVRADTIRPLAVFMASNDSIGINGMSLEAKKWNLEHGFGDVSKYVYVPEITRQEVDVM